MKKRVIIIHGWANTSKGNWFPWLKKELEERGYQVAVPDFPNPEFPKLTEWLETLNKVVGKPDKNLILVGHSLGSVTILRYLEQLPTNSTVNAAILVAGFISPDVKVDSKELIAFLTPKWNWQKIQQSAKKFFLINSDNDRYIPLSDAKLLANKLNQKLIIKKGEDHFNTTSSPKYTKFPYLLKIFDKIESNE